MMVYNQLTLRQRCGYMNCGWYNDQHILESHEQIWRNDWTSAPLLSREEKENDIRSEKVRNIYFLFTLTHANDIGLVIEEASQYFHFLKVSLSGDGNKKLK